MATLDEARARPPAPARRVPGGRARAGPAMVTLFMLVFGVAGWWSGLGRLSDNSFFWHLRTGRWILDHGIPHSDIYSFTAPGTRWVAQSWLAEALYGLLDRTAGPFGVRLLGGVTGAVVAAAVYRMAAAVSRDRVRAVGITFAAVAASLTLWAERPLFLGILALVALMWIVEFPGSRLGRRPMVTVPALMWLWANVHGTFALGFAFLALHVLGRWLDGAPPWQGREALLVKAAVLAGVVCMVNPYGPGLLLFPVELLSRGGILRQVIEWRSPDFRSPQGLTYAVWLAVFVSGLALGRNRASRRDLVVSVPFMLLALWAQRNIALAPLVGLPVLARAVAAPVERPETGGRLGRPLMAVVLALGLLALADAVTVGHYNLRRYPVEAMRVVDERGLLGRRMLTDDAWAGWVILRYWPEQRVFIDDRYDMYPVALTEDFIRFSKGEPGWDRVLERYDIEVVVWERKTAVEQLMDRQDGWRRIHRDSLAVIYTRD